MLDDSGSTFLYICWPCVDLPWRTIYSYPLAIKLKKIFFWLHWVFIAACEFSLVAASGDYSLIAVLGLLIVVVSLVAALEPAGLVVGAHRVSCRMACGVFPDLHCTVN